MMRTLVSIGCVLAALTAVAYSQAMINGYLVANANGHARAQSNANVAVVGNIVKVMEMEVLQVDFNDKPTAIAFVTSTFNKSNYMFDQNVIYIAANPFPRATIKKSQTMFSQNTFAFDQQAQGVAFPMAVEYTEVNNVAGFQAGKDTILQNISFTAMENNWAALNVTTETAAMMLVPTTVNVTTAVNVTTQQNVTVGNTTTVQNVTMAVNITTSTTVLVPAGKAVVTVVKSCNVNNFCFTFRFSNTTFVRNNVTYLADAVKVDIQANTANFNAAGMLAIMASIQTTTDMLTLTDLHQEVDNATAQAAQTNGLALTSPDFVAAFNNPTNGNSAYLNFARTATVVTAANGNTTTAVNAQLVKDANVTVMLQAMDGTNYAQADPTGSFSFMKNVQYAVFSFLNATGPNTAIVWDPEVGMAVVASTQSVVAGPGTTGGSTTTSGAGGAGTISGGAAAGIAIGVIAVAGVAGLFGYRALKARKTDGALLAGSEMS